MTYKQLSSYDPSMTTTLRNVFSRNMNRRFTELVTVVKRAVVEEDVFGLKPKTHTLQMTTPGKEAFIFRRDSEKVEEFMKWLQTQVDKGILEVTTFQQIGKSIESAWTNLYISDSYKRGLLRARSEMIKAGMDIPSMDQSGGVDVWMRSPFHLERLGLLFTRTFNDLKGITAAMDMQIARVLAQGIADGDGMLLLARKLVATINGTGMGDLGITDTLGRFIPASVRAEMLARTEIIRAFSEATLNEMQNWGVEGVNALCEFHSANDDRVCEKCQHLEGKIYTIDEAHGIIPVHPRCRCIWLPWVEELQKYYKK